jgi:nucleotide-binding universal stress UspA family protein
MTYATLMVHLELGRSNAGLLRVTAELAERFGASVIGIAARQPMQMAYGDAYVAGDLIEQDRDEIAKEIKAAEVEFRIALQPRVPVIEWRSAQKYAYLSDYIANEARSADLIVTGVASTDFFDASRIVNTGALVMQAGRPVLIVPTAAQALRLDRVLIGWKDTRETRRAVSDAIPLLKHATVVNVVEIVAEDYLSTAERHVHDVAAWLKRHGIRAEGSAQRSTGDDATSLYGIGQDMGADVVVAGAYGHSRLREWALGGVTRDLLLSANRCSFISH